MSAELRPVSKAVLADAVEIHEARGAPEISELQALLIIATAALQKAATLDGVDDDVARNLKRARKMFADQLPTEEVNRTAEDKGLDLGQYAHTKVFEGNAKKVEKFARLMGGGKAEVQTSHTHHHTFAPDSKTAQRIEHEIEEQFNAAMSHKGKKGLGC